MSASRDSSPPSRGRGVLLGLVAAVVFGTLACLAYFPVSPLSETHLLSCACEDSVDQLWFLAWTAHAISAHVSPLTSTYLDYPQGINVLANVSMMGLGLLLTPVTLTVGPVAAFNLAMRLAFATSALSMFSVLRWWRISWAASMIGGLVYGFSPYMIGQGTGHLHLTFVPIPPLFIYALERGLTGKWTPRRAGLTMAGLSIVQFFIAIEVVTSLMVMLAIVVLGAGVVLGRGASRQFHRVAVMLAWLAIPLAVVLAAPALYVTAGPRSYKSPVQPIAVLSALRADLLSIVVPTNLERFGLATWKTLGSAFASGNGSENGEYLGVPYLGALVAVVAWQWRDRRVRVAAVALAAAFVLTLGPSLVVDGHSALIRLPFDVIAHLPILQDQIALRYSLYLQLFAALLLAVGVDRAWRRIRGSGESRGASPSTRAVRLAGLGTLVLCLLVVTAPLVPAIPYSSGATDVSTFFTSAKVQAIPQGAVALAYPYPEFPADQAMLWQAESGWRFKLLGGYAYRSGPNRAPFLYPAILQPALVQQILTDAYAGVGNRGLPVGVSMAEAATSVRQFIRANHVGVILIGLTGRDPQTVVRVVARALHRTGRRTGNVDVWTITAG